MKLILLAALTWAVLIAGDAPIDRGTLRGLKAVNVVLDRLPAELEQQGLTLQDLRTRLETRLQDAHIPVDESAAEFVGLRVTAVRATRGPFGLSLTLAAYQPATLVRDKNIKTAAPTWDVETVVVADSKLLRQASLESVDELAGRFVSAWKSVNR